LTVQQIYLMAQQIYLMNGRTAVLSAYKGAIFFFVREEEKGEGLKRPREKGCV
jgi:hypothetical protein